MKLTVVRAIPLTLLLAVGALVVSGVHRFKVATHGLDYIVGEIAWLGFLVAALATLVLVAVALHRRFSRRTTIAASCICALAAVAALGGTAKASSAPAVKVTLSAHGPAIVGPTRWHAGWVRIAVTSRVPDQELVVLHFRPGYSYAHFLADGVVSQGHGPAAKAALLRVLAHTVFDAGVDVFPGTPVTFAVDVHAGTYYVGEMLRKPVLTRVTVAGAPAAPSAPPAARVTETDTGYRLPATLPARGTITVRNAGTSMHRLNFIPVKAGTTRAQVGAYVRKTGGRENAPNPPFARPGAQLGTGALSPHAQMQLTYHLPPGEYAVVDVGENIATGRSNMLAGLYAVVTLR